MVGQAAKAADMRAGAVPKPGMKAMNGGGGSVSRSTQKYVAPAPEKPKAKPKAASHSQMVAQWEANGRDADGKLIKHVEKKKELTKEEVNRLRDRALEEKRRAATVVTTAAADAGEEVEAGPEGEPAHELARARMAALAEQLEQLTLADAGSSSSDDGGASTEELWAAAECRRAQLEELLLLEAMFIDEYRLVSDPDAVAALREKVEALGDDAATADAAVLREVAAHPPLECSLQLTAHGERDAIALVASVLVRVAFAADYPKVPPTLTVEDAMVTTQEPLGADKVLATVAVLDEAKLVAAMLERAAETAPDPCIFDAATCLTERAFEFVGDVAWI